MKRRHCLNSTPLNRHILSTLEWIKSKKSANKIREKNITLRLTKAVTIGKEFCRLQEKYSESNVISHHFRSYRDSYKCTSDTLDLYKRSKINEKMENKVAAKKMQRKLINERSNIIHPLIRFLIALF